MEIASELVAPFSEALDRLTRSDTGRICLAVSGGPDSLALLLLANQVAPERIVAATVDHGLRAEAAEEAAFVSSICEKLGVTHATLRPENPITGNMQSSARKARYASLEKFADENDCRWIATAHHADDQVETFLMRLARGSGVDGLASIRTVNGRIIRPLLGFAKAQLEELCREAGIDPVLDPSNDDTDFDRVRMRKWLAENALPVDASSIIRSAAALDDASWALGWMTGQLAATHISEKDGKLILDIGGLPAELRRRLLLHALDALQPGYVPRGEKLERAMVDVSAGGKTMLGNIVISGGESWVLEIAPPRKKPS